MVYLDIKGMDKILVLGQVYAPIILVHLCVAWPIFIFLIFIPYTLTEFFRWLIMVYLDIEGMDKILVLGLVYVPIILRHLFRLALYISKY